MLQDPEALRGFEGVSLIFDEEFCPPGDMDLLIVVTFLLGTLSVVLCLLAARGHTPAWLVNRGRRGHSIRLARS